MSAAPDPREATLSELVVIGYKSTADAAAEKLIDLSKQYLINLEQVAVVSRDADGKLKSDAPRNFVAAGALGGMFWGGLFGLLFLAPVAGMAVGAGAGALGGKLTDLGVKREFQDRVGDLLQPGKTALFVVYGRATADKGLPEMQEFGGEVLRTSLSVEDEQQLAKALHE